MIISDGRKIKVYNGTATTISANKVVIVKGKTAHLASYTDDDCKVYPLGYTLTSISPGQYGEAILEGSILNINTSAYGAGNAILYLSTNGNLTITAPPVSIIIATISKNDSITGEIYFKVFTPSVATWGDIIGDVTDQQDLQDALDDKVPYTGATENVDLGEYELKAGQIEFDQTPTGTTGVAVMRWNDSDGTVDLGLKGGNVTLQIGQEQVIRIVNKTGNNLLESQYKVVRVRRSSEGGAQGQRLAVLLAQADTKSNHSDILGIVTENINNNQEGFITSEGFVNSINTSGSLQGETWSDGDTLYLSATVAGGLTNIQPTTHPVQIGYVTYAHSNNGKIYVNISSGADELDELHDVQITSPVDNEVLTYEAGIWKNKPGGTGGVIPAGMTWMGAFPG